VEITELAGGLAHELRNPLSTIMIQLKLLTEDLNDPSVPEDDMRRRALLKVEALRREAERLQSLFDDFLALAGPSRMRKTEVDLIGVARNLVTFFEPVAKQSNVALRLEPNVDRLSLMLDERLMGQAFLNLVVNAQQAMHDGGTLVVRLTKERDAAIIEVSDTGVGIPAADRERIFRPFFSTKARGTGLGLPITRRIIREHGGELTFCSRPEGGATFTIRLPLSPDSVARRQSS